MKIPKWATKTFTQAVLMPVILSTVEGQLQKTPSFATAFKNVRHFIGKFTVIIALKNVSVNCF